MLVPNRTSEEPFKNISPLKAIQGTFNTGGVRLHTEVWCGDDVREQQYREIQTKKWDVGLGGRRGEEAGQATGKEEHCGWEEQNEWGLKHGGELA